MKNQILSPAEFMDKVPVPDIALYKPDARQRARQILQTAGGQVVQDGHIPTPAQGLFN